MRLSVSTEEMRWCDDFTIKQLGVPGLLLMENAGGAVAKFIRERHGPIKGKSVAVFCGKGNNGGDGFVAARHLLNDGAQVHVFFLGSATEIKGDAKAQFAILKRFEKLAPELEIRGFSKSSLKQFRPDVIVDAIFGTGFSGKVREPFAAAINWINETNVPVVAVDTPSGVNGTTGIVENIAVRATDTITFGFEKLGLRCNQGQEHTGRLTVADIGIPDIVAQKLKTPVFIVESNDVRKCLPRRPATSHKYSVGKVFVLAGSTGLTGAAAMASMAALRSGAGAVVLGTPESVYPVLARKMNEVMVLPLPSTGEGTLSRHAMGRIGEKLSWADVVIIGPGLSQNTETQSLVQEIIAGYSGKVVLDADGLNAMALAGQKALKVSKASMILSPHTGEYSRIFKNKSADIEKNRVDAARKGALAIKKTIVLKGAPTVTVSGGRAYLNSTGNPGMATAGSGDVLSGMIAGLWAQGMSEDEAAYCGVFLHGLAGDLAEDKFGQRSLLAMDLLDLLPDAFRLVEAGSPR